MKVGQSYLTLCDPMDYTVHGILQTRILEWVAFPFSRGSSQPRSPALQADSSPAEPQGKPKNTGAYPFSSRSFQPRNWTGVSFIADRFFTSWATREALTDAQFQIPSHVLAFWNPLSKQVFFPSSVIPEERCTAPSRDWLCWSEAHLEHEVTLYCFVLAPSL